MGILYKNGYVEKRMIFVINDGNESPYALEKNEFCEYIFLGKKDEESIQESIRKKEVDTVFFLG